MYKIILCSFQGFQDWVAFRRYLLKLWLKRLHRAWHYVNDSLSTNDAQGILFDCEDSAGWHPLLSLNTASVLDDALDMFANHPDLPRLVALARAHVGRKWEPNGDEYYDAVRWALKVTEGYAADFGITLTHLNDGAAVSSCGEGVEE